MLLRKPNKSFFHFCYALFFIFSFSLSNAFAQNGVAINTTGASADGSSILDLSNSINKGLLLPQLSSTGLVNSPATGLIIYQTNNPVGIYCNIGTPGAPNWIQLSSASGNGNYIQNQNAVIQTPGTFNIAGAGAIGGGLTNTGVLTSSNGAINLNVNSGTNVTNISTGTTTGNITIGNGNGETQTTNIFSGAGGVYINNSNSNRPTYISTGTSSGNVTIGGSNSQSISIGASASGSAISSLTLGSTTSSSIINFKSGSGGINLNTNINQATNINTGTSTGSVTIGNGSGESQFTNILSGNGSVNINQNNTNRSTNINTGTSTGNVTIGNTTGNIFLPKFGISGTLLYSSAATGQIAVTAQGATGQVLTSNGAAAPSWTSVNNIPLGQNVTTVYGNAELNRGANQTTFTIVPGLTTSITIPLTGSFYVYIATDGGIQTKATTSDGFSACDIAILIDGSIVPQGGYKRLTALNNANISGNFSFWSMSISNSLLAGNHTISVYAASANFSGQSGTTIGGDDTSILQPALTVMLLKQ